MSVCVTQLHAFPGTHVMRVHKDDPGHPLEVTFSPPVAGGTLPDGSPEGPCAYLWGSAEPQGGAPQSCRPLEGVWGERKGWGPMALTPAPGGAA